MDDAGVVLLFRDKAYLHPEKIVSVSGFREVEMKLLESQQQLSAELNSSWLGSFISTVIGNIKFSIGNIHIKYEDMESNPGHPFTTGLVLSKLSAVTVDDLGKETFGTGGDLDRVKKMLVNNSAIVLLLMSIS